MTVRSALALTAVVSLLATSLPAAAADYGTCSSDTAQRLEYIETSLEADKDYAKYWLWAWNGVYGAGIVLGGAAAALTSKGGERANSITTAVKGVIGIGRNLWAPPAARLGASEFAAMPLGSETDCSSRLAAAEDVLRRNAKEGDDNRWGWPAHLANFALNFAGASVVYWGFDDREGWGSGVLGFAVGEVRNFTYPYHAVRRFDEYERRFGAPRDPQVTWNITPWGMGARLNVEF